MNKFFIIGSIGLAIIFILFIFKPFQKNQEQVISTPVVKTILPSGSQKIEVFAFHATQRCISCINVSKFVKSIIDEKFVSEVNLGKIVFKEINIDMADNRQLTKDYQVTGSSLFITVTKDGQTFKEEDTDVWRYVPYETKLKSYFEAKLKSLL